jgi:hypothetical protein
MRYYPTLHLDTNESKGTSLWLLFFVSQSQFVIHKLYNRVHVAQSVCFLDHCLSFLPFVLCCLFFTLRYVITSSICGMWLPLQFAVCDYLFTLRYVITSSIFGMWLPLQFAVCDYLFNLRYVITSSICSDVKSKQYQLTWLLCLSSFPDYNCMW